MKKVIFTVLCCTIAMISFAQDQVFITGFEDTEELTGEWSWTGGAFTSFVDYPTDPAPIEGDSALVVIYDNNGSEWQHAQMDFAVPAVDLTGMREIRMSVYFSPESTGELRIRLDLPGGNILGFADVPSAGEWHELTWKIDRLTSANSVSSVGYIQGFITPTPGDAAGEVFIDNIYAIRPASMPELEEVLLYGFNEADAETGAPTGWINSEGAMPELANDWVEPSEGSDSMVLFAGAEGLENIATANALEDFDRWGEVMEILFDIRIAEAVPGGWIQSRLRFNSGITGNDDALVEQTTKEIGYTDATEDWRIMLFEVDLSGHVDNMNDPNGWFEIIIETNNGAEADGFAVFVDNFRVAVPVGGSVNVSEWNLY